MTTTDSPLRVIEDRLLVIETILPTLATKVDLADLRGAIFLAVAPLYALIIASLIGLVLFLLPHVRFS